MLHPYLEGTFIAIRTYHDSFKRILNLVDASSRLALRRLHHFNLGFGVVYHAGIKHQAADVLSCLQTTCADAEPIVNALPVVVIEADITDSSKVRLENSP